MNDLNDLGRSDGRRAGQLVGIGYGGRLDGRRELLLQRAFADDAADDAAGFDLQWSRFDLRGSKASARRPLTEEEFPQ
jgi:hypothetical protein